MTITLALKPETERALRQRATETGLDLAVVAQELIERGIHAYPSMAEILAPFRAEVAASGLTDDELHALFEDARNEVWQGD
jgi:hypothetical protein